MPSGLQQRLTLEARDDLREILRYSLRAWGRGQRCAYKTRILDALRELARYPGLGRERHGLGKDVRSFPVGRHVIIYLATDDELIVLRILHTRMDIDDESAMDSE